MNEFDENIPDEEEDAAAALPALLSEYIFNARRLTPPKEIAARWNEHLTKLGELAEKTKGLPVESRDVVYMEILDILEDTMPPLPAKQCYALIDAFSDLGYEADYTLEGLGGV